jgi:uncharacterized protein YbjQ (UPF0145 family)
MMLDSLKEKMRRTREEREKARRDQDRKHQARQAEAQRAEAMAEERDRRIHAIRVITGEVKYRYAILDTIRTVGYCEVLGNQPIDPEEATRRAVAQLQDIAFRIGADAVIHAQYHIVRYTIQRRQMLFTPVYETHVFGTAIKVLGPPEDWEKDSN